MSTPNEEVVNPRLKLVREHIRHENRHDLKGILETFGVADAYEDRSWGERWTGMEGIRAYYESLLAASEDLRIDIEREHVTDETVLLEVTISGTHTGTWYGMPATGRRFAFPLCAIFTFDGRDRLAGERIYYDRATVMQQMGILRDPQSTSGRLAMLFNHPLTVLRALVRRQGVQR